MGRHLEPGKVLTPHCLRATTLGTAFVVDARYEPRQRIAPHSHRLPHCTYVVAGEYAEWVEGCERACRAGDLLFHKHNQVHSDMIGPAGARCVNIEFLWDEPVVRALSARDSEPSLAEITSKFAINRVSSSPLAYAGNTYAHSVSWAEQIYRVAESVLWNAVRRSTPKWLVACLDQLDIKMAEPLRLDNLARLANVHPTHVIRGFRRRLGQTPGEYLRSRRIVSACRLLEFGDSSLAEIALQCGFSDQQHFTKIFGRTINKAPGEFRRWARGKTG